MTKQNKKQKEEAPLVIITNADNAKLESLITNLNVMGEDFFSTAKEVLAGRDSLEIMLEQIVNSGMQTEREINDAFAYAFCKEGGVGKLLRCFPNRKDDNRFYPTEDKECDLLNEVKIDVPCITKGLAYFLIHYSIFMNYMEKEAKLNMLKA